MTVAVPGSNQTRRGKYLAKFWPIINTFEEIVFCSRTFLEEIKIKFVE